MSVVERFNRLDRAVEDFQQAAEGFAELFQANEPRYEVYVSNRIDPKSGVTWDTMLNRLTDLLEASYKLLEAISDLPQKVQELLRRTEWPLLTMPQRAEEVIRFAKCWIPLLEKRQSWEYYSFYYDFDGYVASFLGSVWEDWPQAMEDYQNRKAKIRRDCLLSGEAAWFGDEAAEKSGATPATGMVSVNEATEKPQKGGTKGNGEEFIDRQEGPAEPEGNMTEADALRSLLALFTQHVSDERFTAMAAILADPNRTIDEKLWEIHRRIPIPPTVDGPTLASIFKTTKQAIYRTTWWQRNRRSSDD